MARNPGSLRAKKTHLTLERMQQTKLKNMLLEVADSEKHQPKDRIAAARLLFDYTITKPTTDLNVEGEVTWQLKLK